MSPVIASFFFRFLKVKILFFQALKLLGDEKYKEVTNAIKEFKKVGTETHS